MKANRAAPVLTLLFGLMVSSDTWAFYNPTTGRWLSRDPIQEHGFASAAAVSRAAKEGVSLDYVFARNDPIMQADVLGLLTFDDCSPGDQTAITQQLADVCAKAKAGNCFRCLATARQRKLVDICDGKRPVRIHCEDATRKRCQQGGCGWAGPLNGLHICAGNIWSNPGCGGFGCTVLHELGHSKGGVGGDYPPTGPGADTRSYAIEKCAGCPVDPAIPMPPTY